MEKMPYQEASSEETVASTVPLGEPSPDSRQRLAARPADADRHRSSRCASCAPATRARCSSRWRPTKSRGSSRRRRRPSRGSRSSSRGRTGSVSPDSTSALRLCRAAPTPRSAWSRSDRWSRSSAPPSGASRWRRSSGAPGSSATARGSPSTSRSTCSARRLEARASLANTRGNAALRKLGAFARRHPAEIVPAPRRVHDQALWTILAEEWQTPATSAARRESTNISGGHGCPRFRFRSPNRADRAGAGRGSRRRAPAPPRPRERIAHPYARQRAA